MTFRSLPRRALAVASSTVLGLLSVVMLAGPVAAQTPSVEGNCAWDADSEQWLVTWTVTADAPAGTGSYRLAGVDVAPSGSTIEGIETGPEGSFPYAAGQPLVGLQRLPEGTTAASLTVRTEWADLQRQEQSGELEIPTDCGPPELLSQWSLECEALAITIHNPTTEPVTLTFAPNTGSSVPVEVTSGSSATVEFPPTDGLAVDVLLNGQSIVDQSDPISVTPEQLANLECEDQDGGGGGGLPATGTSALIVAAGAIVLLALGAGLYLLARRRRIRFTA